MSNNCELSPKAREARSNYYRDLRGKHPENRRTTQLRYWEKKARELYGVDYVAPLPGEEISAQGLEVRRAYYAERRKRDPEAGKKYMRDFWERKALDL